MSHILAKLPKDVLTSIIDLLGLPDKLNLRLTCRRAYLLLLPPRFWPEITLVFTCLYCKNNLCNYKKFDIYQWCCPSCRHKSKNTQNPHQWGYIKDEKYIVMLNDVHKTTFLRCLSIVWLTVAKKRGIQWVDSIGTSLIKEVVFKMGGREIERITF